MKKTALLTVLSLSALLISACGTAATSSSSRSGTGGGFRTNSAFANRPLTPEARLALGTIKLEGTPQAVDPAEAAKLLPLWQLLAQLLGSSSSAPQEVTAVLDQIRSTMDQSQVQDIGSMQLTSADMASVFQQARQSSSSGGAAAGATNGGGGGRGGGGVFFAGGGFPGGGFGGAGATGANRTGAGTNGSSTTASTAEAAQQASNQISLILVNQVVQMLESRIKS